MEWMAWDAREQSYKENDNAETLSPQSFAEAGNRPTGFSLKLMCCGIDGVKGIGLGCCEVEPRLNSSGVG
jgi:hypothetical protein